jgi:hypothetical protein
MSPHYIRKEDGFTYVDGCEVKRTYRGISLTESHLLVQDRPVNQLDDICEADIREARLVWHQEGKPKVTVYDITHIRPGSFLFTPSNVRQTIQPLTPEVEQLFTIAQPGQYNLLETTESILAIFKAQHNPAKS